MLCPSWLGFRPWPWTLTRLQSIISFSSPLLFKRRQLIDSSNPLLPTCPNPFPSSSSCFLFVPIFPLQLSLNPEWPCWPLRGNGSETMTSKHSPSSWNRTQTATVTHSSGSQPYLSISEMTLNWWVNDGVNLSQQESLASELKANKEYKFWQTRSILFFLFFLSLVCSSSPRTYFLHLRCLIRLPNCPSIADMKGCQRCDGWVASWRLVTAATSGVRGQMGAE